MVPFLTCQHSLRYCLNYAQRAAAAGLDALTVLGGDESVGPPRCVDHAYVLRKEDLEASVRILAHAIPTYQAVQVARLAGARTKA